MDKISKTSDYNIDPQIHLLCLPRTMRTMTEVTAKATPWVPFDESDFGRKLQTNLTKFTSLQLKLSRYVGTASWCHYLVAFSP
jgi:hypothetical protein